MAAETTFPSLIRSLFSMQNSTTLLVIVLDFQHLSLKMLIINASRCIKLKWGASFNYFLNITVPDSVKPKLTSLQKDFQERSCLFFELTILNMSIFNIIVIILIMIDNNCCWFINNNFFSHMDLFTVSYILMTIEIILLLDCQLTLKTADCWGTTGHGPRLYYYKYNMHASTIIIGYYSHWSSLWWLCYFL